MPTLAEIEQELARRVGPFGLHGASGSSTQTVISVLALRSSVEQGGHEGLFILRRGRTTAGDPIAGFNPLDRRRMVKIFDPDSGTLEVDRPYAIGPVSDEQIELHMLDPEQELRVAVRNGLKRCYFVDRATVAATTPLAERDLTASNPWLTRRSQVLGASWQPGDLTYAPMPIDWWATAERGGNLWLAASPDPFPTSLFVSALRPHSSWVNGLTSTTGPTLDTDTLAVDLHYAVSAAHVYAWEAFRPRLVPVVREGMAPSEEAVRAGWSVFVARLPKPPDRLEVAYPYPSWEAG